MVGSSQTSLPFHWTMISAGIGGSIAELFTLPFDTVKVRLMVQKQAGGPAKYSGMLNCATVMAKEEGVSSLWKGLTPGIQRQLVYCSLRLAMYTSWSDWVTGSTKDNHKDPSLLQKIYLGLLSGGVAISIASPTDLVKIRLQGDRKSATPRYNGSMDAYGKILREEGLPAFWTGWGPNVIRNSVINAAELASYFQIKQFALGAGLKDNTTTHFICGFSAGACAVLVGNPVDVVKTRVMNAKQGQYNGVLDCVFKTLKNEGFLAFYNGFWPNIMRIGTWNMVMFVAFERVKRIVAEKFVNQGNH
ncbi:unnamed protein product [Blepharisma stoltei]|uniref:Mitochondrial uncoupling protein n=1 Tax=Blepharisma stoltei TaxID=1481888 RepID=A0AAU9JTY5_9CILI|nr:unnamed protein product [Blepharisma stoltei]